MRNLLLIPMLLLIVACDNSSNPGAVDARVGGEEAAAVSSDACAAQAYPSAEWAQCEQENYARTGEAPAEQSQPAFAAQWQLQGQLNQAAYLQRAADDPSWLDPRSGNSEFTPLCTSWNQQCVGDPFRYPGAPGPNGQAFYDNEGEVSPFVFYDQGCARISGRLWRPLQGEAPFPAVIIENGSVQAPEPLYWWAAQALVRAGYVVMSFDPRGQGRSDQQTPNGEQGSNANSTVFWDGLVNAIDFFRSTPAQPYPHNQSCAGTYPTVVTEFNPWHAQIDRERLGIAGHSLGGTGVSVVQSYGAPGAQPWPGQIDSENPVKVAVAWDGIAAPNDGSGSTPAVVPRVPILGQNSEYGLVPAPFQAPPDPQGQLTPFLAWQAAGLPVIEQTVRGSTHYEWSLIPSFPTTSWCPDAASEACEAGWGQPFGEHYTVAWFDRWLKLPGEIGYADADQRLLDDAGPNGREKYSYHYHSARDFPGRDGQRHRCLDIRAGCAEE